MFIFSGQLGLQDLSQDEMKDFMHFINAELLAEGAGTVKPVTSGEITQNGLETLMTVVGQAADLIEVAGFNVY